MPEYLAAWSKARKQAYQYLEGFVREGISGAEALTILREQGIGYRMQDFYSDFRNVIDQVGYRGFIERLPDTYHVPRRMIEHVDYKFGAKYHYLLDVEGQDTETGIVETRRMGLLSDDWERVGDVKDTIMGRIAQDPDIYQFDGWYAAVVGIRQSLS